MIGEGVLTAVGGTPLVRLSRLLPDVPFSLFAKLEALNPGGSIKDRPALQIITRALEDGTLRPGSTVIESSSGNMGVGLAQACAYLGLRLICVVDPKTTMQNLRLLEAYGAEVEMVSEPDASTGEYLQARINRVHQLLQLLPNSFWPNQYASLENVRAHRRTMGEIVDALQGQIDYLFCATSTCGTLRGCVEYVREAGLSVKVVAVDAVGSVIFGGQRSKRLIPGHGAAVVPQLYEDGLTTQVVKVTDLECVTGCRKLARREAILAGGSSGAVVSAVEHLAGEIKAGSRCVVILPDRGERYLDTIYSDNWVEQHFGQVSHLWLSPADETPKVEVS